MARFPAGGVPGRRADAAPVVEADPRNGAQTRVPAPQSVARRPGPRVGAGRAVRVPLHARTPPDVDADHDPEALSQMPAPDRRNRGAGRRPKRAASTGPLWAEPSLVRRDLSAPGHAHRRKRPQSVHVPPQRPRLRPSLRELRQGLRSRGTSPAHAHPRTGAGCTSLLDVACGTGGHLVHLRRWYEVMGVDIDAGMLDEARRRLPGDTFVEGDMRSFRLHRTFDAVSCLFSSIGYMRSEAGSARRRGDHGVASATGGLGHRRMDPTRRVERGCPHPPADGGRRDCDRRPNEPEPP